MADEPRFKYGFSTGLFVTRKPGGESLVVGGVGEDASRWTRVLSQRAAQVLWFHLTRYLFPDRSDKATSSVMTAPIRDSSLPTVTTHMTVEKKDDSNYELIGWAGSTPLWRTELTPQEAERFWTALDVALYPVSLPGKSTPTKQ